MGQKAGEMLRLLPQAEIAVIERCSGHDGFWGVLKGNFETALKVGTSGARVIAGLQPPELRAYGLLPEPVRIALAEDFG